MSEKPVVTFEVLGTRVSAVNLPEAVGVIKGWLDDASFGRYVCVTGVHGVTEGMQNPFIQNVHNSADAVVPDGMPLVWLGRWRCRRSMGRVYGPDLMLAVLRMAAEAGWTCYFYGGAPGVAEDLKTRMDEKFPGLKVLGTYCPPFRNLEANEENAVLEEIERLRPDLLWIGLSTPKQEMLMARWKALGVRAKVMLGVGAAFDFHTGRARQAPRWMMPLGLEWLFRLITNPRRLWRRYVFGNVQFLWALFKQVFTGKGALFL